MIIDFNAHLTRDYETKKYLIEEQIADMKENKIDLRVISTYVYSTNKEANDITHKLATEYPTLFIPCATINPKLDNCAEETKRVTEELKFKVIEMDSFEDGYLPEKLEYNIMRILKICEKNDTIVRLNTGSTHRGAPDQWKKYIEAFPMIKFVILHMGAGDYQYGTIEFAKEYDNIYLETSIANEYPALKRCLANISSSRILFGSNYPDYFTELEIMKFNYYPIEKEQIDEILGKNAEKILFSIDNRE